MRSLTASKPTCLRDVMNSKSHNHFRHSINAQDIKKLSFFYAIESRIYNSIYNSEQGKFVKGPLWFTNIMVFDFDFDEIHFPNVLDYQIKLNSALMHLENILGKPKYLIYNKNKYNDFQIKTFFTKKDSEGNDVLNLPKQYGCQIVYELNNSIRSQFVEQVELYNNVRMSISRIVDADLHFKGHMFKNPYNKQLFNVIENKDFSTIDIFELAEKYCSKLYDHETLEKIKTLKPFKTLDYFPPIFQKFNYNLFRYYEDLNQYRIRGKRHKKEESFDNDLSIVFSESRNETLFSFFRSLTIDDIKKVDYDWTIHSSLFDNCVIKDNISKEEFESTKQSVINYKEKFGDYSSVRKKKNYLEQDLRVFKIDWLPMDLKFFIKNKTKFESCTLRAKKLNKDRRIRLHFGEKSFRTNCFDNNAIENYIANIFLCYNSIDILCNIKSVFTPDLITYLHDEIRSYFHIDLGLYDMYQFVKSAIYLIHFNLHHANNRFRAAQKKRNLQKARSQKTKKQQKIEYLKTFGFRYKGNIKGFSTFYFKLLKLGLLKNKYQCKPISFYQSYFHISNIEATRFVNLINKFINNFYSENNTSVLAFNIIKSSDIIFMNTTKYYIINKKSLVTSFKIMQISIHKCSD